MDTSKARLPLVTVCVPVYNGDKYIIEALESIRNQTYENFECHIVNNASTDKTGEFVADFIEGDNRFHLHNHTEFLDIASNWNRTADYISDEAKYFKVVQADDIIFPESIKSMVDLMEKFPSAGIGSSYRLVGTRVDGYGIDYFTGNPYKGKDVLLKHLNDQMEITGSVTQLFFRVEHLKRLDFYPRIFPVDDIHMDTRLAYEMFNVTDLVFVFSVLNFTRRHAEAGTVTTAEKFKTLWHAKESRIHRFLPSFPELEGKYKLIRRRYAYFLLKSRLRNNRACLKWHKKFLKRPFTFSEYASGLLKENRIGARLFKRSS